MYENQRTYKIKENYGFMIYNIITEANLNSYNHLIEYSEEYGLSFQRKHNSYSFVSHDRWITGRKNWCISLGPRTFI